MKKRPPLKLVKSVDLDPESLLCGALHDMCRRIEGAQKIVFELAKKDPLPYPEDIQKMIHQSRVYVVNNMASTVGVRKMAREKWNMN